MAAKYIDLKTLKFILYDVHNLESVLELDYYQDHDVESLDLFLNSVKDFSDKELYPYFKAMDDDPARFEDGKIIVHPQVGVLMKKGGEMGLWSGVFDYEHGGMQIPTMIHTAQLFIQDAANNHMPGYGGLTLGAAELIVHFGDSDLKATYIEKMLLGQWGGTMCLTEPQAGSSLSDITTKAIHTDQGHYLLKGQKIFISGGDHEHLPNFVHLVLARIEGAPMGTKGISLFVVPKNRITADGTLEPNDVITAGDFQKMGQKGYCTTHLMFGEQDNCQGWLVGHPNQGLKYMFMMMNGARIAVGRGAAAIVMAAYYASLEYAQERKQGRLITQTGKKNIGSEPVPIIQHPDVRRMLLLQKAVGEGALSLIILASKYKDLSTHSIHEDERRKYDLLLEILTPIVKSYPSEMGNIAVSNGLQVLGGYGYTAEYILQQYYRDIRIFSIYEGTTGIQSLDLLGRKITMHNGEALKLLFNEINDCCEEANNYVELKPYVDSLQQKLQSCHDVLEVLLPYTKHGDFQRFTADANLFLEFLGLIVIGWMWLDMANHSKKFLLTQARPGAEDFFESKIHTMKFYFTYELPKTLSLAESLKNKLNLTMATNQKVFV